MNILDKITEHKRREVEHNKLLRPIHTLKRQPAFHRSTRSMTRSILASPYSGIIAEFKRRSPSKGWIAKDTHLLEVVQGYEKAGAAGISVLTDAHFFGGTLGDLQEVSQTTSLPVLRKDFIIDPYQIYEAKAHGADIILLIAECLDEGEIKEYAQVAQDIGLEVLLELHDESQLHKLNDHINITGVNNRNLDTFEVDLKTSLDLFNLIPGEYTRISESGIHRPEDVLLLKNRGFDGFLIGQHFMMTASPANTCRQFIQSCHPK